VICCESFGQERGSIIVCRKKEKRNKKDRKNGWEILGHDISGPGD